MSDYSDTDAPRLDLADLRAEHGATLRQAIDWLDLDDAFIGEAGELVVRLSGAELREPLAGDRLIPDVLRRQLIALAARLRKGAAVSKLLTPTIEIPLDLTESIAGALYHHADMYRRGTGDPQDVIALQEAADRLEAIAEEIGTRTAELAKRIDAGRKDRS